MTSRDTEMATLRRPAQGDGLDEKLLSGDGEPQISEQGAGAEKKPTKAVPYSAVFRYMDGTDQMLLVSALVAAAVNGAAFPSFTFIFSGMLNALYSPDVIEKVRGWAMPRARLARACIGPWAARLCVHKAT